MSINQAERAKLEHNGEVPPAKAEQQAVTQDNLSSGQVTLDAGDGHIGSQSYPRFWR